MSLGTRIMIDCSHGNTNKDYRRQPIVFRDVVEQMRESDNIMGMMVESNIDEGNQPISDNMKYGVSITDACINWPQTEELLLEMQAASWATAAAR